MKTTYTNCARCGRTLTNSKSKARGYGRHCAKVIKNRMRILCAAYSVAQVDKAVMVIKAEGMRNCAPGVWYVPASNGVDEYLTGAGSCPCPAGQRGRGCYHRLAVEMKELIGVR